MSRLPRREQIALLIRGLKPTAKFKSRYAAKEDCEIVVNPEHPRAKRCKSEESQFFAQEIPQEQRC
jgi:hypothetical protein